MSLRLLIAPDSFKGSLSAVQAAEAMARGAERAGRASSRRVDIDLCPVSDGGEGFAECALLATMGSSEKSVVHGATGELIEAHWGWCGPGARLSRLPASPARTVLKRVALALIPGLAAPLPTMRRVAVIDCASVVGLPRVPHEQRDPERLSSYGVGELITIALERGADTIIVGLGGSATCDGGIGMATALGVRFEYVTKRSEALPAGADLAHIRSIDVRGALSHLKVVRMIAACDVTNPLFGPNGSAAVYGPQKGAAPEQVQRLDEGLRHLARKCKAAGIAADPDAAGAGAAGGLGFALSAFCGAPLRSGIELMLELVDFRRRAAKADLVITGEGRFDAQSFQGKACVGVARAAQESGTKTAALAGALGDGWREALSECGGPFDSIEAITPRNMAPDEAIRRAPELLEAAAHALVSKRLLRM